MSAITLLYCAIFLVQLCDFMATPIYIKNIIKLFKRGLFNMYDLYLTEKELSLCLHKLTSSDPYNFAT